MEALPFNEPTDKDILVYKDFSTNTVSYLDLRTGKPLVKYQPMRTGDFSSEIADFICDSVRSGKSLVATCTEAKIPQSIFYAWLAIFPEFKKRYQEARKQRADFHFYRALDLAEGALEAPKEFIPGLKLAVDTHKWAAEKSDPERFAKPKEEGNNGMGSIVINLTTGVLDKAAPPDIVVDQFGNFQGFKDEVDREERERSDEPLQSGGGLSSNRWGTPQAIGSERGTERGTEEGRAEGEEEVKE